MHLILFQGNLELDNGSTVFGFAFVDCAALKFWVGSIEDDASLAGLGALLMQVCSAAIFFLYVSVLSVTLQKLY